LGQNPTQAEVADIVSKAPRDVDYKTFLTILNKSTQNPLVSYER